MKATAFKIGTRVTLKRKYIEEMFEFIPSAYSISGKVAAYHHEELAVMFGHYSGKRRFRAIGEIIKVYPGSPTLYLVSFKSVLGIYQAWYENGDLTLIK